MDRKNIDFINFEKLVSSMEDLDRMVCDSSSVVKNEQIDYIYQSHFKMIRLLNNSLLEEYDGLLEQINNTDNKENEDTNYPDGIPF